MYKPLIKTIGRAASALRVTAAFRTAKVSAAIVAALVLASATGAALAESNHPATTASQTQSVNVVNTPTVNVSNVPAVTISGTPTVAVGSLPPVTISGTPTVSVSNLSGLQVGNTAANPAVTQDVTKFAAQSIELVWPNGFIAPSTPVSMYQMSPDGTTSGTPFVVPAGQKFVLTTLDILPSGNNLGNIAVGIFNNAFTGAIREEFYVPDAYTTQFQFPHGIVFAAGSTVGYINFGVSRDYVLSPTMYGYLTAN
jgi:hypothetical protein